VVDITDYDPSILDINSREVYEMILNGKSGWEDMLPESTTQLIKENNLFKE
jgi:hypothetical protein